MKETKLYSIKRVKADSYIDLNEYEKYIRVEAGYVQDTIIEEVIGTCLYDKLCCLINSKDIYKESNKYYKELIDRYLHKIFIWGIPAGLPIPTTFKIKNIGVNQQTDDGVEKIEYKTVDSVGHWFKTRMNEYTKATIDYLCCNKEKFPELCNCECGWCKERWGSYKPNYGLNLQSLYKSRLKRRYW